jgi:hypothetical protein
MTEPTELNFDQFLADAVEEQAALDSRDIQRVALEASLFTALRKLEGMARIIDDDPGEYHRRRDSYSDERLPIVYKRLTATRPDLAGNREALIDLAVAEAAEDARIRVLVEEGIFYNSMLFIEHARGIETPGEVPGYEDKRHMIAMLIAQGMHPKDPWLRFIDEEVPGKGLDIRDPTDRQYLLDVVDSNAREAKETERLSEVLDTVCRMLGLRGWEVDEHSDMKLRVAAEDILLEAVNATRLPGSSDSRIAQRDAVIGEVLRERDIDASQAKAILDYVAAQIPVV